MRRWLLALLVSLASPALAQAPAEPPAAAQQPAAPTPTPPPPTPAPTSAPPPTPTSDPNPPTPPEKPLPTTPAANPTPARLNPAPSTATPPPTGPTSATGMLAPGAPLPTQPPATPTKQPPIPSAQQLMLGKVPPVPPPLSDLPAQPVLSPEEQTRRDIQADARFLFQSLLTGDVRTVASEVLFPFQLEEKRYLTAEELITTWVKQLRTKRTDLIVLYDIEVLPLAEMEKKYGKAPARLNLDLREKNLWAAVGNLSGRPGIFLFRPYKETFVAYAYTD